MTDFTRTSAATSGVTINKKQLKALMRRSDAIPLLWGLGLIFLLAGTGSLYWFSFGTWWVIGTCLLYSSILATALYALSHECAHGTAFRTRWLNELIFWITSLWYFEEPYQRRYTHASHHSYTWINGRDAQMPFAERPFTLWGWFVEVSSLWLTWYALQALFRNAAGRLSDDVKRCTPESEWPKLVWNARAFLAIYLGGAGLCIVSGWSLPLYLIVIPRFVGGPVMSLFILMQHAEMAENQENILLSTRSFRTNRFLRFIYCNMNFHIEHHLYPTVPFHALPKLNAALREQLPAPDPGFLKTNIEILSVAFRRSFGLSGEARSIRQTLTQE